MKSYYILSLFFILKIDSVALQPQIFDIKPEDLAPNAESLDVNKINSSVDVGSFYNIEVSIKQMEDNIVKMALDLRKLKQQVEFAKQMEYRHLTQIQKLEKGRIGLFDNSWTWSSAKLEKRDTYSADVSPKAHQDVSVEVVASASGQGN
jgi:hypothetical protein